MRTYLLKLSFAVLLGGTLAGSGGCGDNNHQGAGTGGQSGNGSGGSTGTAGGGGSGSGGEAGVSACATGAGGAAGTGGGDTGGGVEKTPQQIHDALLNAPTTGGIDVTRTETYSCQ